MIYRSRLATLLCFCYLTGCTGRALDLDNAAPESAGAVLPKEAVGAVWVDDQRLYWLTPPEERRSDTDTLLESGARVDLHSCLKLDCEHTRVTYMRGVNSTITVAVAGGHVYWLYSRSVIHSCPAEGCAAEPVLVTLDPALFSRNTIFAHREYVYWSSDFDLCRCTASGCPATPEVVARSASTGYLVFDDARAYWPAEAGIFSAPSDGSEPPQMVIELPGASDPPGEGAPSDRVRGLAVGDGYLYWTTGKQVFRCPVADCSAAGPTLLTTADADITGLKIDGSAMYWLESGAVHSCPLSGCAKSSALTPPKVGQLRSGFQSASYAVDATDIYWLEAPDVADTPNSVPTVGRADPQNGQIAHSEHIIRRHRSRSAREKLIVR
jgi:hypothetical protein